MSNDLYSSDRAVERPCKKYITFSHGKFGYWDKESKSVIEVPMPIKVFVLRQLISISGFTKKDTRDKIYSNEVADTTKEKLFVRSWKAGAHVEGLYHKIETEVEALGGKYTNCVYSRQEDGELVHFAFSGASLQGWIERDKDKKSFFYEVKKTRKATNGGNEYLVPVFEELDRNEKIMEKSRELYNSVLEPYIASYLETNKRLDAGPIAEKPAEEKKQESHFTDEANKQMEESKKKDVHEAVKSKIVEDDITPEDLPF